jgi:hypothetical protein
MNTITEIQTALDELVAAMVEKVVVRPDAQLQVKSDAAFVIHMGCAYESKALGGKDYQVFFGETPAEAIAAARAYIAALPSPEEAGMREFLGSLSDTMEIARKHSLPDEYVAPLRGVSTAMTENLLTKEANT